MKRCSSCGGNVLVDPIEGSSDQYRVYCLMCGRGYDVLEGATQGINLAGLLERAVPVLRRAFGEAEAS